MSRKFSFVSDRKISYLETSLERLEAKRTEIARKLEELNTAFAAGVLDQEHYLLHRNAILEGKTTEQWDAEWVERKTQFEDTLHALRHNKAKADFRESAKKAFGVAAIFMMVLAALAGIQIPTSITGFAGDSSQVTAEANITAYFAVARSDNLLDGIEFGTATAGTDNNNATDNYNNDSSGSSMYLAVSNDSNVPIDFCVNADDDLNSTDNSLGLDNMTWVSAISTSSTTPAIGSATGLTTSFVNADTNVAGGDNEYFRFWLSIPLSQPAGTYNNVVNFRYVQTGTGC
ncbi:hypothetical protein HN924_03785 [Candidatus Woesearchaeota archaeon]|nr:hypothetical protein [Candidatus Woesearchaeota archaeon]MBT7402232.1 hypothetical protein [Candidatus Woesearchaeota archaeon]